MKPLFSSVAFHPLKVKLVHVWINPTLSGLSPVRVRLNSRHIPEISGRVALLDRWALVVIF